MAVNGADIFIDTPQNAITFDSLLSELELPLERRIVRGACGGPS